MEHIVINMLTVNVYHIRGSKIRYITTITKRGGDLTRPPLLVIQCFIVSISEIFVSNQPKEARYYRQKDLERTICSKLIEFTLTTVYL